MNRPNTTTREYTVQFTKSEQDSIDYFVGNMMLNKAYHHENPESPDNIAQLENMRARYIEYRSDWRGIPNEAISRGLHETFVQEMAKPPQSLDIETAALCDLACPHCFRQYIVTPDKVISENLFRRVIDQAAEIGIPSIKLNWRGEPLLCPKLPEFVAYAKNKGILETIINTNAVTLTAEKSRALINAGLDMMVYSFDGGTAKTYNKMRVGRFKENTFEAVAGNIERFHAIRKEMGALFPRTRIQMVLTPDSRDEVTEFRRIFEPIVDDVLVKAYEERGLNMELYDQSQQEKIKKKLSARAGREVDNLSDVLIWEKSNGEFLIANGRLPCQQLYQRLMVSYDGSVYMCCNDWGTEHPVGYIDQAGIDRGMQDYEAVYERAQRSANGYQLLNHVAMPQRYAETDTKVSTLKEIWNSTALNEVRRKHIEGKVNSVAACRKCTFLDTFSWDKL